MLNISKTGLLLQNQELIQKQKSVISHLFKKLASNLIQGKSLMNISFPVQVFETKSVLERYFILIQKLNN